MLEAEQIIADLAGLEFDPRVAKLLLAILAEERKERETGPFGVSPVSQTQIILTPEGLQAAFVESELPSESDEVETFSTDEEPAPQFAELTVDRRDEFPALTEQEAPETSDYELLTVEAATIERQDESVEAPPTSAQSERIAAETGPKEVEILEPEDGDDESVTKHEI
jgi:hypothetical protein